MAWLDDLCISCLYNLSGSCGEREIWDRRGERKCSLSQILVRNWYVVFNHFDLQRVVLFRKTVLKDKEVLGVLESTRVSPQSTLITVHRSRLIEVNLCSDSSIVFSVIESCLLFFLFSWFIPGVGHLLGFYHSTWLSFSTMLILYKFSVIYQSRLWRFRLSAVNQFLLRVIFLVFLVYSAKKWLSSYHKNTLAFENSACRVL